AGEHARPLAQERDGVAESLLGVQQDGPAVERLAAPLRLREVARRQIADAPARLVLLPAGRELAAQQMQHALRGDRLGIAGIAADGLAELFERRIETSHVLQREAEVEMGGGEARRDGERAPARRLGAMRLPERAQRMAEVGAGLRIVRLELDGAAEMCGRLLEAVELAHRGA